MPFAFVIVGALFAVSSAFAVQEPPEGVPVGRITFEGLENVSEGFVRSIVQSREQQPFSRTQVQRDINDLLRSRKFLAVRATTAVEDQQAIIVFELREKPTVASIEFAGNVAFTAEELQKALDFVTGSPLDEFLVNRGVEDLLRKYREAGYSDAAVDVDRELARTENRVVYRIEEGLQTRVDEIRFEGNATLTRGQLRPKVQTQTRLWPFRKGAFDPDQAERDVVEIERFYRSEGFIDVKAGYRVETTPGDPGELIVVYEIDEGTRYSVARVDVVGVELFSAEQVLNVMETRTGEILREDQLERDARRIRELYGEVGYIDAAIDVSYRFLEEPAVAAVVVTIEEGAQSRFGRITIRGNTQTQDRVVRRELRFYPNEPYNTAATARAERRLRETTLFSRATVTPLPRDADGLREALVEVEETQQVNILFGVGVSTDNGLLGSVTLDNRNFDLFDWPRTWEEFLRGQAFRGAGQRLRVRLEPGNELSRFRVDFTEPYLFDKDLRFDWSGYLFQREREGYNEQRVGMIASLSKRYEGGLLDQWALEGSLRIEAVDIDDIDVFAPSDVRDVRGSSFLTSARVGLVRDTTDSRFLPTEGYRFNISYEQVGAFGGDFTYGRPSAGISWFTTLKTDALDRKSVLALRAESSYIVGDAPVFDRFFGGGFGSLRGFAFRGVSPRNGVLDTPVGGEFVLLTSAEYSFPLYGENVRGVTFLDMGTVEDGFAIRDWRASVGFGLRVNVDFFGPVPLVFDFGFPIASADEDDEQVFNFTFGASF